jgi:hypothetical protein
MTARLAAARFAVVVRRRLRALRPFQRDRGAVTLEVAILSPALLAMISLSILAMRIEVAKEAVGFAAHDAARIASISRTAAQARADARSTALRTLQSQDLPCHNGATVTVNTSQFSVPVGQPAFVTATVVCNVRLGDLGLPGTPGSITLTATFTSYLDQYRGRS